MVNHGNDFFFFSLLFFACNVLLWAKLFCYFLSINSKRWTFKCPSGLSPLYPMLMLPKLYSNQIIPVGFEQELLMLERTKGR